MNVDSPIRFVSGHWFVYMSDRVLGPFTFRSRAQAAWKNELRAQEEDQDG